MGRKATSHELIKECIFTALMDLMKKKEYEKITITDIAKRAGVSRMAYQKLTTDAEFFTCFFITTKENALLFQNCLKANVLEFFLGKIRSHTSILFCSYFQPAKLDPMLEYKMCFFAGGFLHIVRRWVEAGMEESIETMVRFSCGIVERLRQASSLS